MESKIYWDLCQTYQNLYDINESVEEDYSEVVLEYLLDEGYADDVDQAEVILEYMSDEWLEEILEEISTPEKIGRLEKEKGKLLKTIQNTPGITPKDLTARKASHIIKRINYLRKISAGERAFKELTGGSSKKTSDKVELLSPEERKGFRDTRTKTPDEKTSEERAAIRAGTAARAAALRAGGGRYGSTPQTPKSGERAAPARETRAQARAGAMSAAIISPEKDPSGARMTTASGELLNLAKNPTQIRTDATRRERSSGASIPIDRPDQSGARVRGSTKRN